MLGFVVGDCVDPISGPPRHFSVLERTLTAKIKRENAIQEDTPGLAKITGEKAGGEGLRYFKQERVSPSVPLPEEQQRMNAVYGHFHSFHSPWPLSRVRIRISTVLTIFVD
jgi:hypothetical protein